MTLFFRLLGRVRVEISGDALDIESAPVRGLLAVLLLQEGRFVTANQLLQELWDVPCSSARNNLRLHIARLRTQLDRAHPELRKRLVTLRGGAGSGGYGILIEADELDVTQFKRLATRGSAELRSGSTSVAERTLAQALRLWQGPIGQDCTASEHLRSRFHSFDELYVTVRELLIEARLGLGHTTDLVPEIEEILGAAQFREASWGHLMRARYLGGDIAGAFFAWDRARTTLGEELGLDVSPRLCELHAAMLRRDDVALRQPVAVV